MSATNTHSLGINSFLLKGFATTLAAELLKDIDAIASQSPLRQMTTRRGYKMSAQMTSCGQLGWVSDSKGYRYQTEDPLSGQHWPVMPTQFLELAQQAALVCNFSNFVPDVCML
jgi:alkylated DNA repair protein (DNA oxidative demethylase)